MSIVKETITGIEPTQSYKLKIDNGDLQAMREVMDKYGFIDEEKAIRFALYVLLKAEKNAVYVDEGDKKVSVTPSSQTVKPK